MVKRLLEKLLGFGSSPEIDLGNASNSYDTLDALGNKVAAEYIKQPDVESVEFDEDEYGKLLIVHWIGGGHLKANYPNLLARIAGKDQNDADLIINDFITASHSAYFDDAEVSLECVYAIIQSIAYLESFNADSPPEEMKLSGPLSEPFLADTVIFYQEDRGDHFSSISINDECLKNAQPDLKSEALKNIDRLLADLKIMNIDDSVTNERLGSLFFIEKKEVLSTALLLSSAFQAILEKNFEDGCYIAIPRREDIVAISKSLENPIETIRGLVKKAFEEDSDLVSEYVFEYIDGNLEVVEGPCR